MMENQSTMGRKGRKARERAEEALYMMNEPRPDWKAIATLLRNAGRAALDESKGKH